LVHIEIQTSQLHLRPYRMKDIDDLHRLWTDPKVRKYLWDDIVISREQAASVVQSSISCFKTHDFGQWLVLSRSEGSLVGFCGFRFFGDQREIELLYGVAPAYWGRGLATEAARAALRYGFEECGFERVYAGADPPNTASFRVMEKLGMTFSRRTFINGMEAIYYVLSRGAFEPDESLYRVLRRD
jgi:ribosomal-protein-alanine N-acetyltransferase